MSKPLNITVLGSTGSIGLSTLSVLTHNPGRFTVFALTANNNAELLWQQINELKPKHAVILNQEGAALVRQKVQAAKIACEIHSSPEALAMVASANEVDYVMAAIVGAAGLLPTLAAARAGKRILLANKEALVMSGELFMTIAQQHGALILPVDSEHNAIYQSLPANHQGKKLAELGVTRIILTASGGAFRNLPLAKFKDITPEQACTHPNWNMGKKITVDSATMMNKALEIIEAHWLFNASLEQIQPILHPQSIIHSMVEYTDSSVLAQLGQPDMRTPIAHVLGLPERIHSGVKPLNFLECKPLEFFPMDEERYPCITLAPQALKMGGTASTILNAANEVAVQAFLTKTITFPHIYQVVAKTLDTIKIEAATTLDAILAADAEARLMAMQQVQDSF